VSDTVRWLPVIDGASRAAAPTAPPLAGLRLLVVEDDTDTADLLKTVLGYYGADVTAATSSREALDVVERLRPDVLISDISMPGEDGYTLVRQIRSLAPERGGRTPALALTAHARAADTEQAFLAGFEAHVAKPVEPAELADVIARLAGRAPSDRALAS
jgi:CheY-like chemotaxis protein